MMGSIKKNPEVSWPPKYNHCDKNLNKLQKSKNVYVIYD